MIESGQLPPEDIIALIEEQSTLWVRVAAVRQNDEWHETYVEMTSGVAPASWVQRASSDQVRALARSRPPADQPYGSPFGLHGLV